MTFWILILACLVGPTGGTSCRVPSGFDPDRVYTDQRDCLAAGEDVQRENDMDVNDGHVDWHCETMEDQK